MMLCHIAPFMRGLQLCNLSFACRKEVALQVNMDTIASAASQPDQIVTQQLYMVQTTNAELWAVTLHL